MTQKRGCHPLVERDPDEATVGLIAPVVAVADDDTVACASEASVREVYRLFLDSQHAPALALADALIESGDESPMLIAIARECRLSLEAPPSDGIDTSRIDGSTTLAEVASLARTPLEEVIALLERLIALGSTSRRPSE